MGNLFGGQKVYIKNYTLVRLLGRKKNAFSGQKYNLTLRFQMSTNVHRISEMSTKLVDKYFVKVWETSIV